MGSVMKMARGDTLRVCAIAVKSLGPKCLTLEEAVNDACCRIVILRTAVCVLIVTGLPLTCSHLSQSKLKLPTLNGRQST